MCRLGTGKRRGGTRARDAHAQPHDGLCRAATGKGGRAEGAPAQSASAALPALLGVGVAACGGPTRYADPQRHLQQRPTADTYTRAHSRHRHAHHGTGHGGGLEANCTESPPSPCASLSH